VQYDGKAASRCAAKPLGGLCAVLPYDLKIRLRNLGGYAAFLFLSYFMLSATAVATATSKR